MTGRCPRTAKERWLSLWHLGRDQSPLDMGVPGLATQATLKAVNANHMTISGHGLEMFFPEKTASLNDDEILLVPACASQRALLKAVPAYARTNCLLGCWCGLAASGGEAKVADGEKSGTKAFLMAQTKIRTYLETDPCHSYWNDTSRETACNCN